MTMHDPDVKFGERGWMALITQVRVKPTDNPPAVAPTDMGEACPKTRIESKASRRPIIVGRCHGGLDDHLVRAADTTQERPALYFG